MAAGAWAFRQSDPTETRANCIGSTGTSSITADAMNNLSDAGASIITVLGFKLSGKKPDKDHPFGHERTETIASLFVGILILVLGFETAKEIR